LNVYLEVRELHTRSEKAVSSLPTSDSAFNLTTLVRRLLRPQGEKPSRAPRV